MIFNTQLIKVMEVPQDAKTLTVLLLDFSRTCVFSNIYIYIHTHTHKLTKKQKKQKRNISCALLFFCFCSSFRVLFMHLSQKKKYQMPKSMFILSSKAHGAIKNVQRKRATITNTSNAGSIDDAINAIA